jgi:hypothetical protein
LNIKNSHDESLISSFKNKLNKNTTEDLKFDTLLDKNTENKGVQTSNELINVEIQTSQDLINSEVQTSQVLINSEVQTSYNLINAEVQYTSISSNSSSLQEGVNVVLPLSENEHEDTNFVDDSDEVYSNISEVSAIPNVEDTTSFTIRHYRNSILIDRTVRVADSSHRNYDGMSLDDVILEYYKNQVEKIPGEYPEVENKLFNIDVVTPVKNSYNYVSNGISITGESISNGYNYVSNGISITGESISNGYNYVSNGISITGESISNGISILGSV